MPISDIAKVEKLIAQIQISPQRSTLKSLFVSAYDPLWYAGSAAEAKRSHAFRSIFQDIWNLLILIHRIEWMRNQALKDEDSRQLWRSYTAADIGMFHQALRSIFDYAAKIIVGFAVKPKQIPSDSFRKLAEWLDANAGNKERLGPQLAEIVQSASWFREIRAVRDGLIHEGALTAIFASPEQGILFQIYGSGVHSYVSFKPVMYNENVADFRLYCALVMARLLDLLGDLGSEVMRFAKNELPAGGTLECIGLDTLRLWSQRLAALMRGGQ